MSMPTIVSSPEGLGAAASRWRAALGAWLLGAVLLFVAGFAGAEALHDAAHDSRHSFTFPCH